MHETLEIRTDGQGLYECTDAVTGVVAGSNVREGLCTVFIRHTSASLIIQENADPSARVDMERWIARLVPEGDPHFTHTAEGPDDMPAHLKAILTQSTLSVPIIDGELALGTWQGIYLWEHRHRPHRRQLVVQLLGHGAGAHP